MKAFPIILGIVALGVGAGLYFMRKNGAVTSIATPTEHAVQSAPSEHAVQSAPVQAMITANAKPAGGWVGYIPHGGAQYPKTQEEADRRMEAYRLDQSRIASGLWTYDQRRSDNPVVLKSSIPESAWWKP